MDAFGAVERLVRAWDVPVDAAVAAPEGTTGACVTLRLGGRVIGRGAAMSERGDALTTALREAWREADGRMVVEQDALAEGRLEARAARVIIDLQLSGSLTPILGDSFVAATRRLSPGLDGVAMGVGPDLRAVFPGTQLTTGLTPDAAMQACAGMLDLPPLQLRNLRERHGAATYAFRARHLAQPAPGREPIFLYRGGAIVPPDAVDGPGLRAFADGAAAYLGRAAWSGPEPFGLRGDYEPATGQYPTPIAPPREQGVAALAIAVYARTPGIDDARAAAARTLAKSLLHMLSEVAPEEQDPLADVAASAAWLLGALELAAQPEPDATLLRGAFAEAALDALLEVVSDPERFDDAPPGARAMVALALGRLGAFREDAALIGQGRSIVRGLFRQNAGAQAVALMPWLGWAEVELAGGADDIPAEIALLDMRDLLWEFQLAEAAAPDLGADMTGGIIFAGQALPTWQTLRPVAFAATMLGDHRLTDPEAVAPELGRLRSSLRFAMQLSIREAELHMMHNPRRAVGGVRRSLWEQTISLDATSLALIAACETLQSVAARSRTSNED